MRAYRHRLLMAALAISCCIELSASACGYHDPQQVRIGSLNWIYPNSLHVNGAIDDAQREGILPSDDDFERISARGPYREQLDALAFQKTVRALRQLGKILQTRGGDGFSMVLVETALWSTFPPAGSGQSVQIDVESLRKDDLVLVTGEPVVLALIQGDITLSEAYKSGFVKLYGTQEQISRFFATYGEADPQPGINN